MARHATGKKESKRRASRAQLLPPQDPNPQPVLQKHALWRMREVKRLVRAIFSAKNPVEVGTSLLQCKSDATRAKIFAMLLEYLYGKPVQQMETNGPDGEKVLFQFVTHAPRPERNPATPGPQGFGGDLGGGALSVPPAGTPANDDDTSKEDEND